MAKALSAVYLAVLSWALVARDPLAALAPGPDAAALPGGLDKAAHFAGFAGLALVVAAARWPGSARLHLGLMAGYALATECVQAMLPWRGAELADALCNLAGIGAGLAAFRAVDAWRRRRRQP